MTDERIFELVENYIAKEAEKIPPNPSGIMFRFISNEEYLISTLVEHPKDDIIYQMLRNTQEMTFMVDTGTHVEGYFTTIPLSSKLIIGEKIIE